MKNTESLFNQIAKNLEERANRRSAWGRGVYDYAVGLLDDLKTATEEDPHALDTINTIEKALLNGAKDWREYSWGGCSLIYNGDIAKTLCSPSELKKTRNGQRRPNHNEEWLDTQARALYQACHMVICSTLYAMNH